MLPPFYCAAAGFDTRGRKGPTEHVGGGGMGKLSGVQRGATIGVGQSTGSAAFLLSEPGASSEADRV